MQTIVDSDSSETLKFYWKVTADYDDYLEFYIDNTLQTSPGRIEGDTEWAQQTHTIPSGIHTLKWCYTKGSTVEDDCGWVDFVEWTGTTAPPDSNSGNWEQIDYKYDVLGRRSEKDVDGYATRYVYDGDHVIAEYDGNNNLLRKYIYGPGVDKPVSMIEVADSNATYYYHYDALGSVIALSDSGGDTVQTYEYSVFGEVAVEDANHTNPYMFAGRRYDIEIGLYYNRARYYNPFTGRFLQTDPIGYGDGMNMYAYCGNNPVGRVDPTGLSVTVATGRSMIIPWMLNNPATTIPSKIFAEGAGILMDVKELLDPDLPAPMDEVLDKYLEIMEEQCGGLAEVVGNANSHWRTFIETQEYADTDKDGKPDLDENGNKIALSEPSWEEVRGVRVPWNEEHEDWLEGAGYGSKKSAQWGAIIGMRYYSSGSIPEAFRDPWLQGGMYDGSYNATDPVLDALIKIGDVLEAIKKAKDEMPLVP